MLCYCLHVCYVVVIIIVAVFRLCVLLCVRVISLCGPCVCCVVLDSFVAVVRVCVFFCARHVVIVCVCVLPFEIPECVVLS